VSHAGSRWGEENAVDVENRKKHVSSESRDFRKKTLVEKNVLGLKRLAKP